MYFKMMNSLFSPRPIIAISIALIIAIGVFNGNPIGRHSQLKTEVGIQVNIREMEEKLWKGLFSESNNPEVIGRKVAAGKQSGKWFSNGFALFKSGAWINFRSGTVKMGLIPYNFGFGYCSDGRKVLVRSDPMDFDLFTSCCLQPQTIDEFVALSSGSVIFQ